MGNAYLLGQDSDIWSQPDLPDLVSLNPRISGDPFHLGFRHRDRLVPPITGKVLEGKLNLCNSKPTRFDRKENKIPDEDCRSQKNNLSMLTQYTILMHQSFA
jgi:hypothetical protein